MSYIYTRRTTCIRLWLLCWNKVLDFFHYLHVAASFPSCLLTCLFKPEFTETKDFIVKSYFLTLSFRSQVLSIGIQSLGFFSLRFCLVFGHHHLHPICMLISTTDYDLSSPPLPQHHHLQLLDSSCNKLESYQICAAWISNTKATSNLF